MVVDQDPLWDSTWRTRPLLPRPELMFFWDYIRIHFLGKQELFPSLELKVLVQSHATSCLKVLFLSLS